MAGYRRAFSSNVEFAQFCMTNLNATPVYDSAGTLIGVKGTLVSNNYASYYSASGQLVRVDDPVVSFLGGTTGTVVVGSQLLNLRATVQSAAITAIIPPPPEDVWTGSSPPSSASSAVSLAPALNLAAPSGYLITNKCSGSPPVCYVNGQRGHQTCDFDSLTWTAGCVVDSPAPVTVSVLAPTSFRAPLGTAATFQGSINDPFGRDNSGTWSAPAGTGALLQSGNNVTFYPYVTTATTLTLKSNIDPTKSATAAVTVPFGSPLPDTGTYPDQADDCVLGDSYTKACVSGQTYHHNFWLYNDRGARTDYVVCGLIGCGVKDRPGPQVVISLGVNFYFRQSGTGLLVRAPAGQQQVVNNGHTDIKAWRVFFGNSAPPSVPGVDDIAGVCALHSSSGNLGSRTGQDSYINGCR